ncbi:MAG TPA: hypothetical protein VHE10_00665 [Candidatus Paceibacterota bacterium]|nr:hypothetical protein [Candidatus Paceibacterota bacterium]
MINKVTNKLQRVVHVPARGKRKGSVLISYITDTFTLFPWEYKTDPHSNYWESAEMARLFSVRGYDVDIINAREHVFIPKKPYVACIDIQQDLERLSKYLPASCKKAVHIDNPYYAEYNEREKARLTAINKRRGTSITPKRQVAPTQSVAIADFLEGFGNENVLKTFERFGKPMFPVPISVVQEFPFPENKDFAAARKHFLYFGGGGAILKGLDLAIEAFAGMPDLTLHILGPAAHEPDFAEEYEKELALPNIIRYTRPKIDQEGRITVGGRDISEVFNACGAIIYPSSAEGTSGAVIQSCHGGLVPIVTPQTGLNENLGAIVMENPTVESVRQAARGFSMMPEGEIKEKARQVWNYVRSHHTKKAFSEAYGRFIDDILKL